MAKKTVILSEFDNRWYKPGNKYKILIWYLFNRLFFNTYIPYPSKFKVFILRLFGANIGDSIFIKPKVNIKYPWLLSIGKDVWIGENVWIDNLTQINIASNVCISQGAMLLCGNHNYKRTSFDLMIGEISLEEGIWLGAKTIICPGVTCKNHSILTVGSVATKNLEPYAIYQGNPAQKVKERIITE